MSFDLVDLGVFLLGSVATYAVKQLGVGQYGPGGPRKRASRNRSASSGQDHQPQGGDDEKPAHPVQQPPA